jgi:hypothetical protein
MTKQGTRQILTYLSLAVLLAREVYLYTVDHDLNFHLAVGLLIIIPLGYSAYCDFYLRKSDGN